MLACRFSGEVTVSDLLGSESVSFDLLGGGTGGWLSSSVLDLSSLAIDAAVGLMKELRGVADLTGEVPVEERDVEDFTRIDCERFNLEGAFGSNSSSSSMDGVVDLSDDLWVAWLTGVVDRKRTGFGVVDLPGVVGVVGVGVFERPPLGGVGAGLDLVVVRFGVDTSLTEEAL